ncbi:MAG: TrkH family potassium uptake protein [Candidatus Aminicenantes bacterium]|nr:TrkH family potassium uptake protein [Candidatus Aminicenantes bacterium]
MKNRKEHKSERRFSPAQFLALSFLASIAVGAGLFLLPISTKTGHLSLIDALFRSTSSVCVTGLSIHDTASTFTPIGQVINMLLFQLGGVGIMTFSTLILFVAGKKISFTDRIIIQQEFHHASPKDVKTLIKNVFFFVLGMEAIGAFFLYIRWGKGLPFGKGLFQSIFHSISAFCNAGFSLFSDSLEAYRNDIWINVTMMLLIVFGGIGFLVLMEGKDVFFSRLKKKKTHVSLHSKIVLSFTFFLIFIPWIVFLIVEWNQSLQTFPVKGKVLAALFQVVSARTAGFSTMNLSTISFSSVMLLILLMFIGASSGSTGGGIKTSTFGVIFAFLKSKITARNSVNLFYRTLPNDLIMRAFTVVTLSFSIIFFSSFILSLVQPEFSMREVVFEVFSAFGTVGLSLGITSRLNTAGKIVILLTMYIGRIGPLTLLWAFSRQKSFGRYEYLEENVMIG